MTRYEIELREGARVRRWTITAALVGSIPAHATLVLAHNIFDGSTDAVEYQGLNPQGRYVFEGVAQ